RYDSALVPQPYLARAWVWSADRKSLVFRLQRGVRWHDGTPTTARDVVWTLSAARDPATGYARTSHFPDVAFVNHPNDSTAGIQPANGAFVRRDTALTVLDYPLIFPYGIVFNVRRPPFDDPRVRLAVALALDRREIVDGYLYGFGAVADGPVPPGVPGYVAV